MNKCTKCLGMGGAFTLAGPRYVICSFCDGTGLVTDQKLARIERGERIRRARIAEGKSVREKGAELGIEPQLLSAIEFGRAEIDKEWDDVFTR